MIRNARAQAQHMLVLDAGDSLLNDRHPAKRTRGQSSIEALNLMGYDALTLGMLDISLLSLDELRQRISEANFAVLSANAYVTGTQDLIANPFVVIQKADHRIGILGLTEAGATPDVLVTDPLQAAKERLPELQSMADIVIVLSHAGLDVDRRLAEQVAGIDLIVSGRGKTVEAPLIVQRTGTVILHADTPMPSEAGLKVGVAQLAFDKAGHLQKHTWKKIVLTSEIAEDPTLHAWVYATPTPTR